MARKQRHKDNNLDKPKSKYKLSLYNEHSLGEIWTLYFSQFGFSLLVGLLIFIIAAASLYLFIISPFKNMLPGYLKDEVRSEIIDNALRIDSLEQMIYYNEQYMQNFERIITDNISLDSIPMPNGNDSLLWIFPVDSLQDLSPESSRFIENYEEDERYTLNLVSNSVAPNGFVFYPPIKGVITNGFTPNQGHYGIDIMVPNKGTIAATLDGTVISAYYTIEALYVIEIQHSNNFISKYKYNSDLLAKVGDKVSAGQKIAIANDSPIEGRNPSVEFQLWHKGVALNPEEYIIF